MHATQKEYITARTAHNAVSEFLRPLERDWTKDECDKWDQTRNRLRWAEERLIDWALSQAKHMPSFAEVAQDVPRMRASDVFRQKLIGICLGLHA